MLRRPLQLTEYKIPELLVLRQWVNCVPEQYRPCPEGWAQHGASCFQYNDTAVSQREAAETCYQHGAHLVIIDDDSENSFVEGKGVYYKGARVFWHPDIQGSRRGQEILEERGGDGPSS